jgi:hypothetical protein
MVIRTSFESLSILLIKISKKKRKKSRMKNQLPFIEKRKEILSATRISDYASRSLFHARSDK